MRNDRWSTKEEIEKVLDKDGAGPVLKCENGDVLTHNGEGHAMILGVSGSGKSRRGTIPQMMTIVKKKENAVVVDPKGEIYARTKHMLSGYDVHVIDFRKIFEEDAEGWNPLYAPYTLWKKGDAESRCVAEQMVEELAHTMYVVPKNADPFWVQEARNVFTAAVYAIFEAAGEDQINLASVYYLISLGDERIGSGTYLKSFVDMLSKNENVAMQLQSYITTAPETRGGIRSTFLDGLSIATKSESVRNFLSHDELHINDLRGDRSTIIYIIVPDETPIYDALAGVLVSQIMNHYVRMAVNEYDEKLPIRLNVLLEELGNIGRAITNLPHLMTAGRSRNIRVTFVLQSISQLVDIYGESSSTTIISNCDVRIAFRVNHYDTLTELSRLCGERVVDHNGHSSSEPLITQSQLAAMETGQALVMISGRVRFVTWIPDYTEMSISRYKGNGKTRKRRINRAETSYFNIKEYVDKKRQEFAQKATDSIAQSKTQTNAQPRPLSQIPSYEEWMEMRKMEREQNRKSGNKPRIDVDDLIKKIDAQIEKLEKEEAEKRAKEDASKDKSNEKEADNAKDKDKDKDKAASEKKTGEIVEKDVIIVSVGDVQKTALALGKLCGMEPSECLNAVTRAKKEGYRFKNMDIRFAEPFVKYLKTAGTTAVIVDPGKDWIEDTGCDHDYDSFIDDDLFDDDWFA
ncbi:MAG: type IV secretory system conjugative DNA transfer family protein [Lachnospiraceae bacterium]|nr:type IV secretory system conjugative DNA transfer family protein [Lachnospiraceae bacterium]